MPRICAREDRGKRLVTKNGSPTITGTSADQSARTQINGEEFRPNARKPRTDAVPYAVIGSRPLHAMPVCRVTRRLNRRTGFTLGNSIPHLDLFDLYPIFQKLPF